MKDFNISGTIFSFAIHRWQGGSFSASFNKHLISKGKPRKSVEGRIAHALKMLECKEEANKRNKVRKF